MMGPEEICPHCKHEWRTHREMLCYRCNEFHTVCGMCMDFGICFTQLKDDVEWEEVEDADEGIVP